ncbi:MAG: phosphoribosylanthranilate isomerase [Pseudomonadales bacterium]
MSRTRVKICGITNSEDARAAVALGACALGFVFHPGSPRQVAAELAAELLGQVPAAVTRVGLFVDAERQETQSLVDALPLDLLQFHGDEDAAYCESFGLPYMKAVRGTSTEAIAAGAERHPQAAVILVDSSSSDKAGAFGGSGKTFDWGILPSIKQKLVLAGGLNPGNVADAIRQASPYAVDVSTGVEADGDKRKKDHAKLRDFFESVQAGDEA